MAATNNLQFYPDITKVEYIETLQKNIEPFNTRANPYVRFSVRNREGDIQKDTFLKRPNSTVSRADRTSDNSEASLTGINEDEIKHARVEGVTNRYTMGRLELARAEMSPQEFSGAIGRWSAEGQQEDYVESGISALVGALSGVTDVVHNHGAKIGFKALLNGVRTHGDKASDIGLFLMPSGAFYDLVEDNYDSNVDSLVGLSAIQGNAATMGKPVLMADLDALYTKDASGNVTGYKVLGLRTGALELVDIQQMDFTTKLAQTPAGNRQTMMGDYAFDIKVRGASYSGGQDDPTVDELANSSNWTATNSDVKYTAGCLINVNA